MEIKVVATFELRHTEPINATHIKELLDGWIAAHPDIYWQVDQASFSNEGNGAYKVVLSGWGGQSPK